MFSTVSSAISRLSRSWAAATASAAAATTSSAARITRDDGPICYVLSGYHLSSFKADPLNARRASELRLLAFWHPGTVIPLREVSYPPCRLGRIPWSLAGLLDLSCSGQPAGRDSRGGARYDSGIPARIRRRAGAGRFPGDRVSGGPAHRSGL